MQTLNLYPTASQDSDFLQLHYVNHCGYPEGASSGLYLHPWAVHDHIGLAAEMEIEQADISLANTLDTLRATGSGAGGATALAQAALSSKKGVSASIEQQEAQNEKLRAQGEQQLQEQKMAEQQRLQGVQISEGQRVQGARAQGAAFVFGAKEDREMQKLDGVSAQLSGAQARQAQASADRTGALTGMASGLAYIGSAYIGAKG